MRSKNIFWFAILMPVSLFPRWIQFPAVNNNCQVIDLCNQNNRSDWDFFHDTIFIVPELIKQSKQQNYPLFIRVPGNLNGLSPLDNKAPIIEAIRTALAWARVYYVFDNEKQWPLSIFFAQSDLPHNDQIMHERSFDNIDECIFYCDSTQLLMEQQSSKWNEAVSSSVKESIKQIYLPWTNIASGKLRFCISGGAGFIGSALVKKLLQEGYQVIVLDNLLCSTFANLESIQNNVNLYFIQHDVSEPFTIKGEIDVVIHLASVPSPADYCVMPVPTLRSGLQGTKNMLELARHNDARFIFSSTSEVYGDPEISPQSEDYPGNVNYLGPQSAYDQSKRAAETLIKLYFDRYKIDVRVARLFNTYGPGMRLHDGRAITNFIAWALKNRPIKIYGDGSQTRSFGYVDDTVSGLYRLIFADFSKNDSLFDRVFNIGTPVEFTIAELASKVESLSKKYLGKAPDIVCVRNPYTTDPHQRLPDISKAQAKLNFNPKICLDEGLEKTFLYFLMASFPDTLKRDINEI